MTAYITLPEISEEQFLPTVHRAIASTVQQHPMLQVNLAHELDDKVSFSPLEIIRLLDVLTCRTWAFNDFGNDDVGLDAELEREHNRAFVSGLPQWRLLLMRDTEVNLVGLIRFTFSFFYHHVLGDGLSGLAFLKCFVNSLQLPPTSDPISPTLPVSSQALPPNVEELTSMVEKGADEMVSDQEKKDPPISKVIPASSESESPPKVWIGSIPVNTLPVSSRFSSFTVPPRETQILRQICSAQSVSMTPLLQTIVAKSVFLAIPSDFDQLRGLCSLNLRPHLDNSVVQTAMGNYVGGFATVYNRKSLVGKETNLQGSRDEGFWKEVRRTKESTLAAIDTEKKKIEMTSRPAPSGVKTQGLDMVTWMQGLIGQPRVASFDINNLGTVAFNQGVLGTVELGKVVFSASQSAIGSALKINIVTSPKGYMVIGLAWQQEVINDGLAPKIVETVKNLIDDLVATRND